MPKLTSRIPKYRQHRPSGQAVVTLSGVDHYLGPHGTKVSKAEYDRLVSEWLVAGRIQARGADSPELTVSELLARFWAYAKSYYRGPDGEESSEVHNLRLAFRHLRRLYGSTSAAKFGPLNLQAVRQAMIDHGLVRTSINKHVGRIKLLFKWAVANELVPQGVHHSLLSVGGLQAGRSAAKESEPVKPVPTAFVDATLPHLSATVRDMVRLQLLTAARPGEIIAMRSADLDTTGRIWLYQPPKHKNAHRGHTRTIYLGPQAQAIVKAYLKADMQAPLFSPRDAKEAEWKKRRQNRQTPMTPSQAKRGRKAKPKRTPGKQNSLQSYSRASNCPFSRLNGKLVFSCLLISSIFWA